MNGYYGNYYMPPPPQLKVAPINIVINPSQNCVIKQPERIYFVDNTRVVVPEININVNLQRNNNFYHQRKNNFRNHRNFRKKNSFKNNKPNFKRNNKFNNIDPPIKMMKINIDDLKNNKGNPFEDLLLKMFGIEEKKKDTKLEAPIESENNFDISKKYEDLPFKINNLKDLILLSDLYTKENPHQFGINMKRLNMIKNSLVNIENIIGMSNVKKTIFNKLITHLQGLGNLNDMNHIVIQAPPGYGKTMLGFYLSEIFFKLGLIKKEVQVEKEVKNPEDTKKEDTKKYIHPLTGEKIDFPFIIAKRKDLIGKYVGHTAPLVEEMVEKALGGVLFIDEAYSLGSGSKESYSDECINTINQLLSEKAGQFICIIAGYKDQLEKSFFTNPGLKRRFRTVFEINKYSPKEMSLIMEKMINDSKWKIDKFASTELENFMKKNLDNFKYCAGDIEKLLQNVRNAHSKRVLGLHPKDKKIINMEDINNGLELFLEMSNKDEEYLRSVLQNLYV